MKKSKQVKVSFRPTTALICLNKMFKVLQMLSTNSLKISTSVKKSRSALQNSLSLEVMEAKHTLSLDFQTKSLSKLLQAKTPLMAVLLSTIGIHTIQASRKTKASLSSTKPPIPTRSSNPEALPKQPMPMECHRLL